jgi:hypothetical protein
VGKGSWYSLPLLGDGRPRPSEEVEDMMEGILGSSACSVDAKWSGSEGAESKRFIGLDEAENGSTAGIVVYRALSTAQAYLVQ